MDFKNTVCEHWGIINNTSSRDNEFDFYDDNCDKIHDPQMYKTLENLCKFAKSKDLKDKDIFENETRCQLLYLGDSDFEAKYNYWTKLQRTKIEEENIIKRNELIKKKTEDDSISNIADYLPDANENFLKSFPGI